MEEIFKQGVKILVVQSAQKANSKMYIFVRWQQCQVMLFLFQEQPIAQIKHKPRNGEQQHDEIDSSIILGGKLIWKRNY